MTLHLNHRHIGSSLSSSFLSTTVIVAGQIYQMINCIESDIELIFFDIGTELDLVCLHIIKGAWLTVRLGSVDYGGTSFTVTQQVVAVRE